jgi:large subunit ribosomal protein L20
MPRVKRGNKKTQRRKKILKAAKGYYGKKSRAYRVAMEAVDRAGSFAYRDRRQRKRDFRRLWIVRINAAARINGLSYNRLIGGLAKAGCEVNRKMLADIAVRDPQGFAQFAELAKGALEQPAAAES